MADELPCNKPHMLGKRSRYPKAMAKTILKHTLSGLAFLHKHGIVHGDVQPGNLLFAISDLRSISEERLHQDQTKISKPLCRRDGKFDPWGPKYLALGQPLYKYVDLGPNMTIKLSDLGSGKYLDPIVTSLAVAS
jgi:serine/threonine protein kinase